MKVILLFVLSLLSISVFNFDIVDALINGVQSNHTMSAIISTMSRPRFQYRHLHFDVHNRITSLTRRDDSRLMDHCTGHDMRNWIFTSSNCDRRNFQALFVFCHHPNDPMRSRSVAQSCGRQEICVDTGLFIATSRAYCVDPENSRPIPNSDRQPNPQTVSLVVPVENSPFIANAILANEFGTQPFIRGTSFGLAAFRRQGNTESILRRTISCDGCYDIRIQPLPLETNLLRA